MTDSDVALVTIELDAARLGELASIPNLTVTDRPEWVDYPTRLRVGALADAGAQAAVRAMGFMVEIALSPDAYREQVEDVFRGRSDQPRDPDEPA